MKSGGPLPLEYYRVVMCERFGWPLREFDDLTLEDFAQVLAVWDGMQKGER